MKHPFIDAYKFNMKQHQCFFSFFLSFLLKNITSKERAYIIQNPNLTFLGGKVLINEQVLKANDINKKTSVLKTSS